MPGSLRFDEATAYKGGAGDYLGFFQQRPSQGETPQQIMDPSYSLRKFCRTAVDMKPTSAPADPNDLGEGIAKMQQQNGRDLPGPR